MLCKGREANQEGNAEVDPPMSMDLVFVRALCFVGGGFHTPCCRCQREEEYGGVAPFSF